MPTTCVADDILQSVKTRLAALALDDIAAANIKIFKFEVPVFGVEDEDGNVPHDALALPSLYLLLTRGPLWLGNLGTTATDWWGYPLIVTTVDLDKGDGSGNPAAANQAGTIDQRLNRRKRLMWHQRIRRALVHRPFDLPAPVLGTVVDIEHQTGLFGDRRAWLNDAVFLSSDLFMVITEEDRDEADES